MLASIEALDADPGIAAIVLLGAGRNFIAGADVREFDRPPLEPLLPGVLSRLETCGKPVVAALHGASLGGGAETALACHYRCAAGDLQLGFPGRSASGFCPAPAERCDCRGSQAGRPRSS